MSNRLTAEQQRKIEENRRRALERRAQRLGQAVKQTSAGFNSTSVQIQPSKQSVAPDPAALAHHRDTSSPASAPQRFVPLPRKESQSFNNQTQGAPKHQQLSDSGNQINQSPLCNPASSRQVGFNFQSFILCLKYSLLFFLMPFTIFSCRHKLLTHFLRQEVNMRAAQSCLVEEALVWTQLSPNLTSPPAALVVQLAHSTRKRLVNLPEVLWHSFPQTPQLWVLYLQKSLPSLWEENVYLTQRTASE